MIQHRHRIMWGKLADSDRGKPGFLPGTDPQEQSMPSRSSTGLWRVRQWSTRCFCRPVGKNRNRAGVEENAEIHLENVDLLIGNHRL